MRVNVYTEELISGEDQQPFAEVVTAEYVSSRTGEKRTNYGLRVYLRSHPALHYIPGRDDDRSAVTFWCGSKEKNLRRFVEQLKDVVELNNLELWRGKVEEHQKAAEAELLKPVDYSNPGGLSERTQRELDEIDANTRNAYRVLGDQRVGVSVKES